MFRGRHVPPGRALQGGVHVMPADAAMHGLRADLHAAAGGHWPGTRRFSPAGPACAVPQAAQPSGEADSLAEIQHVVVLVVHVGMAARSSSNTT